MKNIVICCDGTGNEYGENNTNVVEAYSVCKKDSSQVVYYDPGVGTGGWEYHEGEPWKKSLRAVNDQATGEGLQKNVDDAYSFLMETYDAGDRLFLFGFSRGAFTVRSLAGMLYKVGLLPADNDNLVEYASKLYNTEGNIEIAHGFRATFSRDCPVHFVGVWDTVSSLAMNAKKKWHNSRLNPEVSFGYQALAIDEQRKDFPPDLWDEKSKRRDQTIEQVWFAGVHSNVGGWYKERGLSNIALQWMMGKAKACGLKIDGPELKRRVPDPHDKLHDSLKGFWNFRGKHIREVKKNSKIHASVFERIDGPRRYQPENLLARSQYQIVT